jgi:hypothetical protein
LIDATKSGLYAVRRRAIEMLLPHLSDDDLFGLDHILADRSREPIKAFLTALLERDAARTASWLPQQKHFGAKVVEVIAHLTPLFGAHFSSNVLPELMTAAFQRIRYGWEQGALLGTLALQFKDNIQVWQLIGDAATKDADLRVRHMACALLLDSLNCGVLQRKLMVYWGRDLKQPITSAHVTDAAQQFNLSVDEVRQQYEAIAAQLPVELILEWRKGH